MARMTWEVEPREDDRWAVQRTETRRADSLHDRKTDAVARARELAENVRIGQVRASDPRRRAG
jgi:hypothetical protein